MPIIVLIVAGAVVALGVMSIVLKQRHRQIADDTFERADEFFQGGAFSRAEREFELFRREYPNDERAGHAAAAEELSKAAQMLGDELSDPSRVIESLDKFAGRLRNDQALKERWPVILTLAQRTARSLLEKAGRSLRAGDLDSANSWLNWLHDQQRIRSEGSEALGLAELDNLSGRAREAIAVESRRRGFVETAERAATQGTMADFAEAFRAYDRWRTGPPGSDSTVASAYDRLRQALRTRVRFDPPAQAATEAVAAVPRLPLDAYTSLITRQQLKKVSLATPGPVFVRAKDLCFSLEPETGSPRWVLRVGYDAPLPELVSQPSRLSVIVPWFDDGKPMISLCDAASGGSIWTWQAPGVLAGPPAVTRNSVFAATVSGTLWQLDLEKGTPQGMVQLPEPLDGPPAIRAERGQAVGLCLVGASQGVYLFDVARDEPTCVDVVLLSRQPHTMRCQALWEPPYLLIFENDFMNRCTVRVLFQETAGHRQIRETELDGRLWQPPVLDGADLFVVTDRGKKYCFGLDPGNPAVNLYTSATGSQSAEWSTPIRTHFAHVAELPFVALSDALRGYRLDRAQALLLDAWTRPLPSPQARGIQPLQVLDGLIVSAFQEPAADGVVVQAVSSTKGELIWETRLAGVARDIAVAGARDSSIHVVARSDSGGIFLVSRAASGEWGTRSLDLPTPVSPVRFADRSNELLFASHDGTRIQLVSTSDWTAREPLVQSPGVRSPLVLQDGFFSMHGPESRERRTGRWVFFTTTERTLEMRSIDGDDDVIHGVRLPAAKSGDEPWRWVPLPVAAECVVVAHPSGIVCRAELRETDAVKHLFLSDSRSDLPPLVAAPITVRSDANSAKEVLLCLGANAKCLLLDTETLQTIHSWDLLEAPTGDLAAFAARVFLNLGGTIQTFQFDGSKMVSCWERRLDGSTWSLAGIQRGWLLAFSSAGQIVALDIKTGQTKWNHAAPGALALPPQFVGKDLVLATIDGGLFFVPGPAEVMD